MVPPEELLQAISRLTQQVDRKALLKGVEGLSLRYRNQNQECKAESKAFIQSNIDCLAYLSVRFPATFAACGHVFLELKKWVSKEKDLSILDLGSGSGSALWAANEVFSHLGSYTLVEREEKLISLGKELLKDVSLSFNPCWIKKDYSEQTAISKHDLVLFSYTLGECDKKFWKSILDRAVELAEEFIVIIEPGTPLGYQKLMVMRDILIGSDLSIVAPCPHSKKCPLKEGDWCHFSQRLPRSPLHRQLKGGELGFEDEKFSYVVASKKSLLNKGERVIRHPMIRPGFIEVEVCSTDNGVYSKKITKKDGEEFKKAKKLSWGSFI